MICMDGPSGPVHDRCMATRFAAERGQIKRRIPRRTPGPRQTIAVGPYVAAAAGSGPAGRAFVALGQWHEGVLRTPAARPLAGEEGPHGRNDGLSPRRCVSERIALNASCSSKKSEQIVVVQLDIKLFIGATQTSMTCCEGLVYNRHCVRYSRPVRLHEGLCSGRVVWDEP